jgi:hypothetical protein
MRQTLFFKKRHRTKGKCRAKSGKPVDWQKREKHSKPNGEVSKYHRHQLSQKKTTTAATTAAARKSGNRPSDDAIDKSKATNQL